MRSSWLALGLFATSAAFAQAQKTAVDKTPPNTPPPFMEKPAPPSTTPPAIEPLGNDRFRIGAITVDRKLRELRFPGLLSLAKGTLEYVVCAPGGKLYESLLQGNVDPYHLQLALLLIGLEPTNNLEFQGDPKPATGSPVSITLSWVGREGRVSHRAEELVRGLSTGKPMPRIDWVFSGSYFSNGIFAASVNKSLVAVYNDPSAILNNPLPTGGDDNAYEVMTSAVPPVGTEVEIVLRATGALPSTP